MAEKIMLSLEILNNYGTMILHFHILRPPGRRGETAGLDAFEGPVPRKAAWKQKNGKKGVAVLVDLSAVCVANGLGAALMLTLLLSNRAIPRNVFLDDKIFSAMCRVTLCLCIAETAAFWVDGRLFFGAIFLSRLINALLFMATSTFALLWVLYVHYKLFASQEGLRRVGRILAVPVAAVCLMAAANLVADVFFTVSPENVYARTPLFYGIYVLAYGYLLLGAGMVLRYQKRVGKYLFMPVLVFLGPIFVGSLIQLHLYGIALIWVSAAFGLVALYVNLQNEASLLDPLTGLYNRGYLNRFLGDAFQRNAPDRRLAGVMLDVNSFKEINDTFGHSEGDVALKMVARSLMEAVRGNEFAVRYGGDEFIVITDAETEEELEGLKTRIQEAVARANEGGGRPYRLMLAMGSVCYHPDMGGLDRFLWHMDQRMYEEKRRFYSGSRDRRGAERRRRETGTAVRPASVMERSGESD